VTAQPNFRERTSRNLPANATSNIRVVTYNIHKCRGLDRRVLPGRIADVLRELDADVIALQEVLRIEGDSREQDQAQFIADRLGGYRVDFGENRRLGGGTYGNATLTRLPVQLARNYDLSWKNRERRGCLRTDLALGASTLHIFNVHLGTSFLERRHQARRLLGEHLVGGEQLPGPVVVVGDFNEWTHGLASRLMAQKYCSIDLRQHINRRRTYPGVLPILHLDHFYFDSDLHLQRFSLHRSRAALLASDHLPMLGEFQLKA
jgi:endonuclease/exonuclease/phosphatase family metal-dependent hydrolase